MSIEKKFYEEGEVVDGLLLVKKPKGISSYGVVKKIKTLTKIEKIGHAGTLDPSAQGLLLICMGKATKLTPFLQELDKTYQGKMIFGVTTTTFDEEGEIVEKKDASSLTREKVEEVFEKFKGKILQTPPIHSAVHWQGERLYKLARRGEKVNLPPREVYIHKLKILNFFPGIHPEVEFEVRCSKGTYIRSLCHDIGKESGFGAYQSSLIRTKVGPFSIEDAKDLEEIENLIKEGRLKDIIYPPAEALPHFPMVTIKKGMEKMVKWGRPLYFPHFSGIPSFLEKGDKVRICSEEGDLLAVAVSLQNGSHFVKDKEGFKYLRVLA